MSVQLGTPSEHRSFLSGLKMTKENQGCSKRVEVRCLRQQNVIMRCAMKAEKRCKRTRCKMIKDHVDMCNMQLMQRRYCTFPSKDRQNSGALYWGRGMKLKLGSRKKIKKQKQDAEVTLGNADS